MHEVDSISFALEKYRTINGSYPTNEDTDSILGCLGGRGKSNGTVLLNYKRTLGYPTNAFVDPWGTPYKINILNKTNFMIQSAGKNQKLGDNDDWIFELSKGDFVRQLKP